MELLHNEQGHQAVEHMLLLVYERFCWSILLQDITNWVKNCKWCQTAKGPYVDPDPSQGFNYCQQSHGTIMYRFNESGPE